LAKKRQHTKFDDDAAGVGTTEEGVHNTETTATAIKLFKFSFCIHLFELVETTNSIWLKDMTFSPFLLDQKRAKLLLRAACLFPDPFLRLYCVRNFVSFLKFLFGVPDIFVIVIRFWVTICLV